MMSFTCWGQKRERAQQGGCTPAPRCSSPALGLGTDQGLCMSPALELGLLHVPPSDVGSEGGGEQLGGEAMCGFKGGG